MKRSRIALLVACLLLLLVAAAPGLALLAPPMSAGASLDPNIPHERALIDAGLSGTPGTGQPAVPVAVDRVLVDGAATYIQYRIIQPLGTVDDLSPPLADDHGSSLNAGSSGFLSPPGLTLPFPLPAWLPWRPMVSRRAVTIIDAPLPAAARAAVLRFDSPGAHETVRVPLDLRVLVHRHFAYPNTMTRAAGLTFTLQEVSFTHLIYTYVSPPNGASAFVPARLLLNDSAGHAVAVATIGGECAGSSGGPASMSCSQRVVFPPQRAGARLTLTIPAFSMYSARGSQRLLHGPWRLPFVVP